MAESPEAVVEMLTNLRVKSAPDAEKEIKQLKVSYCLKLAKFYRILRTADAIIRDWHVP